MSDEYYQFSTCDVYWLSRYGNDPVLLAKIAGDVVAKRSISRSEESKSGWLASDGHSDVFTCSFNKDTQSAVGVFSFVMRAETRYINVLQPGDLFFIFMSSVAPSQDSPSTLVTVGIADRVTESRQASDGATTNVLTVIGKDFGKILLETQTVFDPAFAQFEQTFFTETFFEKMNDASGGSIGQSSIEMVYSILDLYFNEKATKNQVTELQWRYPGNNSVGLASLINLRDFVQAPLYGYTDQIDLQITSAPNVHSLCESFCNRVLNEFFIDVRDYTQQEREFLKHQEALVSAFVPADDAQRQRNKRDGVDEAIFGPSFEKESKSTIALVYRQLPYDSEAFYKLPTHYVKETEVIGDITFGKSSQEAYNFIRLRIPVLPVETQEFTYGIRINPGSIASFGLKRLELETMYGFPDSLLGEGLVEGEAHQDQFISVYEYYTGIASVWNACNEHLLSGSITLRFRPEIRVGTRLSFSFTPVGGKLEILDFYIQSVSHSFNYEPGTSRTTLILVRGIRNTENIESTDKSSLLTQSMIFNKKGIRIPQEVDPWIRVTAIGSFEVQGENVPSISRGIE